MFGRAAALQFLRGQQEHIPRFHVKAGQMQEIRLLYDLQERDWKLSAVVKELAEVRAKLADDSALDSARKRVESLRARLEDLTSRHQSVDRVITQLQERLQRAESRLYGGAVTSQKEFSAAEEERDFTERQQREEEDRLLEIMVEAEDVEVAHVEAQDALARIAHDWPIEQADLRERERRLSDELATLSEEREEVIPLLPPRLLAMYESLRKSRNGYAVARVERGICEGCHLSLPLTELRHARSAPGVVQCGSCRRILYVV